MYTNKNFKSKKELKLAVDAWNAYAQVTGLVSPSMIGAVLLEKAKAPAPVTYYQPGPFGGNEPRDGTIYCEGPHYPQPHKWYAQCEVKDGVIVKVK